MPPNDRCEEWDQLAGALIIAACKVLEAQLQLDKGKQKNTRTRKHVAAFRVARHKERVARPPWMSTKSNTGCRVGGFAPPSGAIPNTTAIRKHSHKNNGAGLVKPKACPLVADL
jgi:hypothetical protein